MIRQIAVFGQLYIYANMELGRTVALFGAGSIIIEDTAGANDVATITGSASGSVTDGGTDSVAGDLNVADADAGEAVFATPASLVGTYGDFSFNATTGAWSYALANGRAATQALTAGEPVTDTLTVTSADGTDSQVITVTVAGADGAATITGAATGTIRVRRWDRRRRFSASGRGGRVRPTRRFAGTRPGCTRAVSRRR